MPHHLNSVTIVPESAADARQQWARLGFALLPGGVIALGSTSIVLRDAAEPTPAFGPISLTMTELPNPDAGAPAPHPNGARALAAVAKTMENPADHAETLGRAANQREMRATSAGVELKLANARLEALTSAAFAQRYGAGDQALVFTISSLKATRAFFNAANLAFEEKSDRLVLAERPAGLILAFEAL
ncbi:hypothetical protein M2323_002474 [Rhodoblastus acidophilus]|uniref:hypothetical protein n=1 Tax=Rhodoblastus acidophilus TaxID=1074 RepID=UPI002225A086|nr:hypothetical protein [Rhodoblastus acidophilus]MCW2284587.1 hypothetical protein [Rhodoblastus acidophilus]MCW2333540.1 hypothetical protein [Rhodoblastus acidophilus]